MKKAKVNTTPLTLRYVCGKSKEKKRSMFCDECSEKALKMDLDKWN